jgi:hypothetical protein
VVRNGINPAANFPRAFGPPQRIGQALIAAEIWEIGGGH